MITAMAEVRREDMNSPSPQFGCLLVSSGSIVVVGFALSWGMPSNKNAVLNLLMNGYTREPNTIHSSKVTHTHTVLSEFERERSLLPPIHFSIKNEKLRKSSIHFHFRN